MKRSLAAGIATVAVAMSLVTGAFHARSQVQSQAQSNRWGAGYFPNLPVVTQDGKTLRFYDDVIKGKMVLIDFIYTNCPDLCPLTTARLTQVEDALGDMVGRDIFFVSMTVDPERDTPQQLKQFADGFHIGPGWLFLTGRPEDIRAINAKLGDKSRALDDHRNEIVLGNDKTGEWMRNTVYGDLDRLLLDIRAMDPSWRDQVRQPKPDPASNTGYALGNEPGQALFKRICAPCHTIGVGDRAGPDLRGVTERRDRGWLTSFITRPDKMLAQHDPTATALAEKYPGVRMPPLSLSDTDAGDVISYLKDQTAKLEAAQDPPVNHVGHMGMGHADTNHMDMSHMNGANRMDPHD
jgi:cytochrome oxidase Cu insertion factor (SCO1/SenC/PrrC family)/mono/diheme cytochrome c family protein